MHLDDGSGRVLLAAGEIRGNDVGVASELDIALLAEMLSSVWLHDNDVAHDPAPRPDPRLPPVVTDL
ncbi:MAG: hypothetical protein IT379_15395 [Deltaproteobacteria bacterium]|nr:hypothetical protein [Deltaproteobacteria bacterium]